MVVKTDRNPKEIRQLPWQKMIAKRHSRQSQKGNEEAAFFMVRQINRARQDMHFTHVKRLGDCGPGYNLRILITKRTELQFKKE